MSEPYLILHKVRGEPAFDIAHKLMFGEEEGWIVGTSGHRAYPYWTFPLYGYIEGSKHIPMPEGWPDHYSCNDPPAPKAKLSLASLGLQDQTLIKRRKLV